MPVFVVKVYSYIFFYLEAQEVGSQPSSPSGEIFIRSAAVCIPAWLQGVGHYYLPPALSSESPGEAWKLCEDHVN